MRKYINDNNIYYIIITNNKLQNKKVNKMTNETTFKEITKKITMTIEAWNSGKEQWNDDRTTLMAIADLLNDNYELINEGK